MLVLFTLLVLLDLLDDVGEGDRPHPLEGRCLDLLVEVAEDRLDGPTDQALRVGGRVNVQEVMVHLEGLVDVQQGDRPRWLSQGWLGPAGLGDQQAGLTEVGHQLPDGAGVGLDTIGNRLARPVPVVVDDQVGQQVDGITEFVGISHNAFILASSVG